MVLNARNCAANVNTDIRDNFKVQGLVKPDTGTDILVNSANNDIMSISNRDILILCGGANDVGEKIQQRPYNISWTSSRPITILI